MAGQARRGATGPLGHTPPPPRPPPTPRAPSALLLAHACFSDTEASAVCLSWERLIPRKSSQRAMCDRR